MIIKIEWMREEEIEIETLIFEEVELFLTRNGSVYVKFLDDRKSQFLELSGSFRIKIKNY